MSKLSQRILKATRIEAPPVGFGVSATRQRTPTMLLVARLHTDRAEKARAALSQGADVLLLEGDVEALKGSLKDVKNLGDVSVGLRLPSLGPTTLAELKGAVDFAVFDAETSAAEAILDEEFGYVLALPQGATDTELRVFENLPLDALLVPPTQGPLTVQAVLSLRRFFVLSRTPLLVEVRPDIAAGQLRSLRDAGVVGVTVDGTSPALADLRQTIDSLPPRGRHREERAMAILPAAVVAAGAEEEEEEP